MKTLIFSAMTGFYKAICTAFNLSDDEKRRTIAGDYRAQGYSFLSISDHDVFFSHDGLCSDDFLTLPTVEYAYDLRDHHYEEEYCVKTHHIMGIIDYSGEVKCERPLKEGEVLIHPRFFGESTAQSMRKTLESRGAFCVYNHPSWSKTDRADYGLLQGFAALEIYNFSGEVDNGTGGSFVQWDALLDAGAHINGVATDDNHNQGIPDDSYGGFVQVWSDDFSRRGICAHCRGATFPRPLPSLRLRWKSAP